VLYDSQSSLSVVPRRLHRRDREGIQVHQEVFLPSVQGRRSNSENGRERSTNSPAPTSFLVNKGQRSREEEQGEERSSLWALRWVSIEGDGEEGKVREEEGFEPAEEQGEEDQGWESQVSLWFV
jgi:hypothetical protein